jgi:hypothetical protein
MALTDGRKQHHFVKVMGWYCPHLLHPEYWKLLGCICRPAVVHELLVHAQHSYVPKSKRSQIMYYEESVFAGNPVPAGSPQ